MTCLWARCESERSMTRLGELRVKRLHRPMRALSTGAIFVLMPFMAGCSGAVTSAPEVAVAETAAPTSTAEPAATPTSTSAVSQPTQTPVAAKVDTGEATWLEYVRSKAVSGTVRVQTDDELVASARKMCGQMRDGELFEEVALNLANIGLPKPYQSDMQLIFGTGTVHFCPEFQAALGTDDVAILERLRTVAPTIAANDDSAILSQARTACPSVSRGPAGAAQTIQEARRAWGHEQGYKFIFISVLSYCSSSIDNVLANK